MRKTGVHWILLGVLLWHPRLYSAASSAAKAGSSTETNRKVAGKDTRGKEGEAKLIDEPQPKTDEDGKLTSVLEAKRSACPFWAIRKR